MGVTVQRKEPVKAPPIEKITLLGNASGRGFEIMAGNGTWHGKLYICSRIGSKRSNDAQHGYTITLSKSEAKQLIADLSEMVGD